MKLKLLLVVLTVCLGTAVDAWAAFPDCSGRGGDSDGDGFCDFEEAVMGTDVNDPASNGHAYSYPLDLNVSNPIFVSGNPESPTVLFDQTHANALRISEHFNGLRDLLEGDGYTVGELTEPLPTQLPDDDDCTTMVWGMSVIRMKTVMVMVGTTWKTIV